MDLLLSYGITIGVLAGVWVVGSSEMGVPTWPTFISWACYYAIVGTSKSKFEAVQKTIFGNLAGLAWGVIAVLLAGFVSFPFAIAIAVCIACLGMCVEAHWGPLSYIPAAFCGCAIFFGLGAEVPMWVGAAIAMVAGAILAYISQIWGLAMAKKEAAG